MMMMNGFYEMVDWRKCFNRLSANCTKWPNTLKLSQISTWDQCQKFLPPTSSYEQNLNLRRTLSSKLIKLNSSDNCCTTEPSYQGAEVSIDENLSKLIKVSLYKTIYLYPSKEFQTNLNKV